MEPKGWRPDYTHTGGIIDGVALPGAPDQKFDDRPSRNPYPPNAVSLQKQFSNPPLIAVRGRQYEHRIFTNIKLLENGDMNVDIKELVTNIRRFKALQEELVQGPYMLPADMQRVLDRFDGMEEAYA